MHKFTVAGALKVFSLLVFILGQSNFLSAVESGSISDLDTVKSIYQKIAKKNKGPLSQEQLVSEFNAALQDESFCNGLSSCELKNKEEYVWFFLGVMSMLGVIFAAKIIVMLADSPQLPHEGVVAAESHLGEKKDDTSKRDAHSSKPAGTIRHRAGDVRHCAGDDRPHGGNHLAGARDFQVNTRDLQLDFVDGQLRLVLNTKPDVGGAAPEVE